jgi:hypothetical protein
VTPDRWLETHRDTVHTTWLKEMAEGIEARLAAAKADAGAPELTGSAPHLPAAVSRGV